MKKRQIVKSDFLYIFIFSVWNVFLLDQILLRIYENYNQHKEEIKEIYINNLQFMILATN